VLCETTAWCKVTREAKIKTNFGVLLTIHTTPELGAGSKNLHAAQFSGIHLSCMLIDVHNSQLPTQ
jgi:hypothetical protein